MKRTLRSFVKVVLVALVAHLFSAGVMVVERSASLAYEHTRNYIRFRVAERLELEPIKIVDSFTADELAERAALRRKLNPSLLRAIKHVESRGKALAESPKGAIGLMQIMPANAKRCGLKHYSQLFDPETNIDCGAQIISEELNTYGGDAIKALIAYNGGPRAVKAGYPESVKYAQNVLATMSRDIR